MHDAIGDGGVDGERALVGRRIAAAMVWRGVSAADLSRRAGIHRQTLWRYTRGRVDPSFLVMARIASALSISLDYFASATPPE
jgi:transcriptional regulator with XRE-family HTH domain